jgi:hypothetical protein
MGPKRLRPIRRVAGLAGTGLGVLVLLLQASAADDPQRIFNPRLLISIYGKDNHTLSSDDIKKIKSTSTPWPPNAQPNGAHVVQKEYSTFNFPYVYLPAGFRLSLADDVSGISWQIGLLEFGVGASFDISAVPPPPPDIPPGGHLPEPFDPWPPPPDQPDMPGQADYHRTGAAGLGGQNGRPGNSGRPLNWLVTSQLASGSLWIITNGGIGGPGGRGGKGQLGGGSKCDGDGQSNGGDGGRGGPGGDGGKGGATSTVSIQINSLSAGSTLTLVATAGYCGSAFPPSSWTENYDDGRIVVWGAPGCGGYNGFWNPHGPSGGHGGNGGGGGPDGRLCREFGFPPVNYFTRAGNPGAEGPPGNAGLMGDGGIAQIVGPPTSAK